VDVLSTLQTAQAVVADPTASALDLAAIAAKYPSLQAAIAVHPNAYPELLTWLSEYGDDDVKQAVAARQATPDPQDVTAPAAPTDWTQQAAYHQVPPPGSGRKAGLIVGAILVVIALVVAGIVLDARNRGSSGGQPAVTPSNAVAPLPASFAWGSQTTWTITPADLGITPDMTPSSGIDSFEIRLLAATDQTWLIGVGGLSPTNWTLFGVDAKTGASKWGSPTDSAEAHMCAYHAINGQFYCDFNNYIFSVAENDGHVTDIATPFKEGEVIQTVDGPVTVGSLSDWGVSFQVTGDNLLASDYENNPPLVSLISPSGQIKWTNGSLPPLSCNGLTQSDAWAGGIVVINSSCGGDVLDVKTGKLLYSTPNVSLGVVDESHLWGGTREGAPATDSFATSDGTNWTVFRPTDGYTPAYASNPERVAPVALTGYDVSHVSWWEASQTQPRWSIPASFDSYPTSAYDGEHLILSEAGSGQVIGVSPTDGSIAWHIQIPATTSKDPVAPTAILADGTALTWTSAGATAYSADTGDIYWTTAAGSGNSVSVVPSSPGPSTSLVEENSDGSLSRIDPATPQTRVPSMPADMPSCPEGWTPVGWSSWTGGHTLICANAGRTYYIEIDDGSKAYSTSNATRDASGVYSADFGLGQSGTISLGNGLIQLGNQSFVATSAWDRGTAGGFTNAPSSAIPACPAGSYPMSLSIWSSQWLLTCGIDGSVASFYYYNGHATDTGGAMANQDDMTCGTAQSGATVCVGASRVTVTSNGDTAAYDTSSDYVPGTGQSNEPVPTTYPSFRYGTYYNARYGFSVDYPVELMADRAPDNGDGQRWTSERGNVEYIVSGSNNPSSDAAAEVNDRIAFATPPGAQVTYHDGGTRGTNAWGVVSGWDPSGARGFYTYVVAGPGSVVSMTWHWDRSADWTPQWTAHTFTTLQHSDLSRSY